MRTERLYLIGAGGHAKVVLDALTLDPASVGEILVVDDNPDKVGGDILGHPVLSRPEPHKMATASFHLAIGRADVRARVHTLLVAAGARPVAIRHPDASIAKSARVAEGSFVAARSVVAADARVGSGTIVNHGAVIDHDCIIDDFTHIAPNATLGGGVVVEGSVLVGAGATILPGVRIGAHAVIAAGATVVRDVAAYETVIFELTRKKGYA